MDGQVGIAIALNAEPIAQAIEKLEGYRVLRRLTPIVRRAPWPRADVYMHGVALDVETTGLDPGTDAIIELALQRFLIDREGAIVDVGHSRRWFEDPGRPISAEITALTGIRQEDVQGRVISEAEAGTIVYDCDFVVAHNARFDRGFVEARLPLARGKPWICTVNDVDWRAAGFEGRSLGHLTMQMGWFYDAHRADVDVTALLRLLDHDLGEGCGTVMAAALAKATQPSWVIEAAGAPFASKDALKRRGYRWDARGPFWWREVAASDFEGEMAWAEKEVYHGEGRPRFRRVDWTTRHAER